jgi:hypothetical protein
MEDKAEMLMLNGVVAFCVDCADERVFVPVEDDHGFCCTSCDAAVFLLEVLDNTGLAHRNVA